MRAGDLDGAVRPRSRYSEPDDERDPRRGILLLELDGLIALVGGDAKAGIALLEAAAHREEALPYQFGPPATLMPPHELLATELAALGRHGEARAAWEEQLARTPKRTQSLLGLARTATALGDEVAAREAYAATPLTAQTSIGARAGMTRSTFSTSESFELSSVTGVHVGVTASFTGDGAGLILSAAYSQRGMRIEMDRAAFWYRLGYLEVGAFGKFPLVAGPYVLAGPTVGRRVACYRTASDGKGTNLSVDCATEDDDDPFKTYDFGVSVGAGMSFDLISVVSTWL